MYFIGLLQDRDGNLRPLLQTWIDLNYSLYKQSCPLYAWNEIIYAFLKFEGAAVEVVMSSLTLLCMRLKLIRGIKINSWNQKDPQRTVLLSWINFIPITYE